MVVDSKVYPISPLRHSKFVAGRDGTNGRWRTPGTGVLVEDGIVTTIAPEDLKRRVAKDDVTDRSFSRHLASLEVAFGEFRL